MVGAVAASGPTGVRKIAKRAHPAARSSSTRIRAGSPALQVAKGTVQKYRAGSPVPIRGGSVADTDSGEEFVRPVFSQAEQRIIDKGREVAEKAAEVQKAEYQVKLQQEAASQSWQKTQQREEASRRMFMQSQAAAADAEHAKAAVASEIQVVQAQVGAARAEVSKRQ